MEIKDGAISLQEFNEQVSEVKIDELNSKFQQGVITMQQYNIELAKVSEQFSASGSLRSGTEQYLQSVGTTSAQVADAIKGAFGSLETFFNNFIETGKLNFKEFTKSVLDDIQRIIVRAAIVQPLAQGILGAIGSGGGTTGADVGSQYSSTGGLYAAKGQAFSGSGNVIAFARGGIVDSPTSFGYGSSKTGLMGEAGPEAILPLSRGAGGNLGVQASVTPVTINIINNADTSVDSKERTGPNGEKMIDIIISAKVKEGIAAGTYDKAMQQSYGLFRKGS
jgi:lambda family phage tail tape measure protein